MDAGDRVLQRGETVVEPEPRRLSWRSAYAMSWHRFDRAVRRRDHRLLGRRHWGHVL